MGCFLLQTYTTNEQANRLCTLTSLTTRGLLVILPLLLLPQFSLVVARSHLHQLRRDGRIQHGWIKRLLRIFPLVVVLLARSFGILCRPSQQRKAATSLLPTRPAEGACDELEDELPWNTTTVHAATNLGGGEGDGDSHNDDDVSYYSACNDGTATAHVNPNQ